VNYIKQDALFPVYMLYVISGPNKKVRDYCGDTIMKQNINVRSTTFIYIELANYTGELFSLLNRALETES